MFAPPEKALLAGRVAEFWVTREVRIGLVEALQLLDVEGARLGVEALHRDVDVVLERPPHRVVEGELEDGPRVGRGR